MATDTPVRVEVRLPGTRPSFHEVTAAEFLIGSVAGCDLVIPGSELPPVIGVIARTDDGLRLRKLAPNLKLSLNGKAVHHAPLTDGDAIGIGNAEIRIHIPAEAKKVSGTYSAAEKVPDTFFASASASTKPWSFNIPMFTADEPAPVRNVDPSGAMRQLQQESDRLKQQGRELDARHRALEAEEANRRQAWAEREAQLESELDQARDRRLTATESVRSDYAARDAEREQRAREIEQYAQTLNAEKAALERAVREHREDLARLDRHRDNVGNSERELQTRAAEVERRESNLNLETQHFEGKIQQLRAAEDRLAQEQDRVRQSQAELDAARGQIDVKLADLDRRDGTLKSLELRLESLRQDLTRETQLVTEERGKQASRSLEIAERETKASNQLAQLEQREARLADEKTAFEHRQMTMQEATLKLKALQENLTALEVRCRDHEFELSAREAKHTADRAALETAIHSHREDLARLDRFRESLESRERLTTAKVAEVEAQAQKLQVEAQNLQELGQRLTQSEAMTSVELERLRQLQLDHESSNSKLAAQTALTEGQQSALASLRTKMERMRDELRIEAQKLTEQRARQESLDRELVDKQRQLAALHLELEAAQAKRAEEEKLVEDRHLSLHSAVGQMKSLQDRLTDEEKALIARAADMDAKATAQAEQAAVLRTKAAQLLEFHQKIEADRLALVEREQELALGEAARKDLQEQLLRRTEAIEAKRQAVEAQSAELARWAADIDTDRQHFDGNLTSTRDDLQARAGEMAQLIETLEAREEDVRRKAEKLKEMGQALAAERKSRFESKSRWEEEHRLAAEDLARTRAELETYRQETLVRAAELQQVLPEMEERGQSALERLAQAREQLKSHVAELHTYARQSHDDLESLRIQVTAETERLREQSSTLVRARGEHRHAVTAFRQQLIDWQGRVAEMKQTIVNDGGRLERKQSELDEAAKEIESTSHLLARQAAELQAQEESVAKKREEVEFHLSDMRDWFRRKLKELAESSVIRSPWTEEEHAILASGLTGTAPEPTATDDGQADIVSITADLDPGDRRLGELLQSMELVDNTTLTALLLEARRQRRSLRQVLLASGKLTVYQMALIEAGNLDGLTVGPLGVIDRLRTTPHETVYRVIDPRAGASIGPVVLRHLSDMDSSDAIRPDEFRQRFAALADVHHPHVLTTIEVLDLNGRPAALQEWLTGLPSSDWPSLAASPGVWYRLTCQALLGLATAHQAGLVHGALTGRSIVLTADGLVKLTGVGEPPWLCGADPAATPAADLLALGKVAAGWAALMPKRKGAKAPKPLPEGVRDVLDRWLDGSYESANAVLDDLDANSNGVPAGTETWERLVKYAGENGTEGVAWRKSA